MAPDSSTFQRKWSREGKKWGNIKRGEMDIYLHGGKSKQSILALTHSLNKSYVSKESGWSNLFKVQQYQLNFLSLPLSWCKRSWRHGEMASKASPSPPQTLATFRSLWTTPQAEGECKENRKSWFWAKFLWSSSLWPAQPREVQEHSCFTTRAFSNCLNLARSFFPAVSFHESFPDQEMARP